MKYFLYIYIKFKFMKKFNTLKEKTKAFSKINYRSISGAKKLIDIQKEHGGVIAINEDRNNILALFEDNGYEIKRMSRSELMNHGNAYIWEDIGNFNKVNYVIYCGE